MKFLSLLIVISGVHSAAAETLVYEPIEVDADIKLTKTDEHYYVHTSWFDFPGVGRFPSNGLIFVKNGKALKKHIQW